MLEIGKKKMVTTRKAHTCHHCTGAIQKGEQAVAASAKEDEKHVNLHFHIDCSARHARALRAVDSVEDLSIARLSDHEYPF